MSNLISKQSINIVQTMNSMPDYYLVINGKEKLSSEQVNQLRVMDEELETAYKKEVWLAFKANYAYANEEAEYTRIMADEAQKEALITKATGFAHLLINANAPLTAVPAIFNHSRQFKTHPTATSLLRSWREICHGWGLSERQKIRGMLNSSYTENRTFDPTAYDELKDELKKMGFLKDI